MKNQAFLRENPSNSARSGNALVITLVAIVLLGALTAMLMRSSSQGGNNYNAEDARMIASRLMSQAQKYEGGISKIMQVNGCGENDIDFTNTTTTRNYAHTPVGPNRCQLFDVEGAGLAYAAPPTEALDKSKSASADYGDWVVLGSQCVWQIGTGDGTAACVDANAELLLYARYIRNDVCSEINKMNGLTAASTSDGIPLATTAAGSSAFSGTYTLGASAEIGNATANSSSLVKHPTGCYKDGAAAGTYTFYHVLLSR